MTTTQFVFGLIGGIAAIMMGMVAWLFGRPAHRKYHVTVTYIVGNLHKVTTIEADSPEDIAAALAAIKARE